MGHHCHATGCTKEVPPEMFMCKKHWFSLPKILRDRVWKYYRPGQCDDREISLEYSMAAQNAIKFIAAKEGKVPDVSIYKMLEPKENEA